MKKTSVLHIGKYYAPELGGIETHLGLLCKMLQKDYAISVIVFNRHRKTVREMNRGIPLYRIGTAFQVSSAPVGFGMGRLIRQIRPDLVHIHLPNPTAVLAFLASGFHTAKLVLSYHSDIVRQRIAGLFFNPFLNKILDQADAVITSSESYARSSSPLQRVAEKVYSIPYGISIEDFGCQNDAKVRDIRARYGDRIVLALGRYVYYKGFEYLIDAMGKVQGQAVIIGAGPQKQFLEKRIHQRQLDKRVHLLTLSCEENLDFLNAADVFVLPSIARSEAFGIVQLEAMACGKPVINTSLDSGTSEVSLHGVTGLTVPPRNADALAAAINQLLDNPDLRKQYGEAGRARVIRHFSAEGMAESIRKVYQSVLNPV